MTVFALPLKTIYVDPKLNVSRGQRSISPQSVSSLVQDIESNGQLEPIGVVTVENAAWLSEEQLHEIEAQGKEFVLVFGFRRFAALSEIAKKKPLVTINAIAQGRMTLASAELANVAENWSREPPNEFDLTMACDRFVRIHKLKKEEVATRINRSPAFVESCIRIASVAPDVLDNYRVNCSREVRRRMLELADIEAMTSRERHELQREAWKQQESNAAAERRTDPQGGMRRTPPKRSNAIASRTDLKIAGERIMTAREAFNGREWVPIDNETRNIVRELIRWSLDVSSDIPVR